MEYKRIIAKNISKSGFVTKGFEELRLYYEV